MLAPIGVRILKSAMVFNISGLGQLYFFLIGTDVIFLFFIDGYGREGVKSY